MAIQSSSPSFEPAKSSIRSFIPDAAKRMTRRSSEFGKRFSQFASDGRRLSTPGRIETTSESSEIPKTGRARLRAMSMSMVDTLTSLMRIGTDGDRTMSPEPLNSEPKGKTISQTYQHNNQVVMTEVVERVDVVSPMEKSLTDHRDYLRHELQELDDKDKTPVEATSEDLHELGLDDKDRTSVEATKEDPEKKRHRLAQKLAMVNWQLGLVEKAKNPEDGTPPKTWASSLSYRRMRGRIPDAKDVFVNYLPVCVNLRTQTVLDKNNKPVCSINRSGAISDFHNGHTNLQEMTQLRDELRTNLNTKSAMTPQQQELAKKILPNYAAGIGDGSLLEQLESAITDRTGVIEIQGLQDLTAHFAGLDDLEGQELEAWLDEANCDYERYSMLDGIKPPKTDRGQVINEGNQMLDMAALYSQWDGKELVFDGQGPFRDEEGKIHLPFKKIDPETNKPAVKKLDVTYWNISTTMNTQNEGPQKEINKKAIQKLEKKLNSYCEQLEAPYLTRQSRSPEDLANWYKAQDLRVRLYQLSSSLNNMPKGHGFDVIENLATLSADLDKAAQPDRASFTRFISINCFSGKDRTGQLAAMITQRMGRKAAENMGLSDNAVKALVEKWGRQAMSRTSVFYGVIEDNIGRKAIKLLFRDNPLLRGTGTGKVKGIGRQLIVLADAANLVAREKLNIESKEERLDQL